ncbi:MAG: hypothetical protein SWE60_22990 [Thermodesulfobacteriota bacterium]|nr:hypothetical protein [Thermodesulfobacteriota bacterium]
MEHPSQFEPPGTFHYFRLAVEVVKCNRSAMAEVAGDKGAIRFGIGVTAIGGAIAVLPHTSLAASMVAALCSVGSLFFFAGFLHLIAGRSRGREEFMAFVRIFSLTGIIDWLAVLPLAGLLATIWSVIVAIVAAEQVYEVNRAKATLTVLLAVSALWVVTLVLLAGPLGQLYDIPGS